MDGLRGPWRSRQQFGNEDFIPTLVKLQPDRAIEQLETNRARLMLAGLLQLPTVPYLYQERFIDVLRQLELPDEAAPIVFHPPNDDVDYVPETAAPAYRALLDEIGRAEDGWTPTVLPPPLRAADISVLAAATPATALVYLQMREGETLALIATEQRRSGLVLPLKLNQLLQLRLAIHRTADRQEGIFARITGAGAGAHKAQGRDRFNQERFAAALEECIGVIGENIWRELDAELQRLGIKRLILLPDAFLALFPLHAAPLPASADGMPGARALRALERYTIGYAPSAQVYAYCLQAQRRRSMPGAVDPAWSALAIDTPATPSRMAPIATLAPIQALSSQPAWGERRIVWTSKAAQPDIAAAWTGAGLIHIHVHGQFKANDPHNTAISLLGANRLTARDILTMHGALGAARLVVMAVCEGGEIEMQISPEFRGLAGAFVEAGAPVVLAAPWRLNEPITTLLLCRLYDHLGSGLAVAEALQQAQLWLWNATYQVLQDEAVRRAAQLRQSGRSISRNEVIPAARVLEEFAQQLSGEHNKLRMLSQKLALGNRDEVLDLLWFERDLLREQHKSSSRAGSTRLLEILETLCSVVQKQLIPDMADLDRRVAALLARPYGAAHYWSGLQAIGASFAPAL